MMMTTNTTNHPVLVVDDDEMIRESIVDFLQDKGYQPIAAVHGRDALDKLDRASPLPCLIVLDLMMPVMDGISFRHEQLQDPRLAGIPVVVVSAYRDAREQAASVHAAACLQKPLKLADLLRVVEKYCPGEAGSPAT